MWTVCIVWPEAHGKVAAKTKAPSNGLLMGLMIVFLFAD
jgi:hypothetical protein